jgi:tetratricopeptide (TPR) repeat protein
MRIIHLLFFLAMMQFAKGQVFNRLKIHRLENLASMHFRSNNYKEAAPIFYTASKLREEQLKFELSELDLYFAGESYLEQNKWDSALFCNNKITDSLKPSIQTESDFLFKTLLQRASILTQTDSLDKAYEFLTQLEENKSLMTDSLLISRIYYCLGQYYNSKELYKETVKASTNAFTYLPNNYINNYYLSKIKLQLGAAHELLSNYTLSENILLEAKQLTHDLPNSELLTAKINNKLGSLYYTTAPCSAVDWNQRRSIAAAPRSSAAIDSSRHVRR